MLPVQHSEIKNNQTLDRISCSLNKADIEAFLKILQERCGPAADDEVAHFQQGNQTNEEFERNKASLREAFVLLLKVTGEKGKELSGPVDVVLNSPNFPEAVETIYINSEAILRGSCNWIPRNSFEILLDFSRPAIMDLSITPSTRTPNASIIKVSGYNPTWVNGLFHEINEFIKQRPTHLHWLHKNGVYDLLLWIFGLPVCFWACFKLSKFLPVFDVATASFIHSAIYVYIFLIGLFIFRTFFHYARWVFPVIEYQFTHSKFLAHRAALTTVSVGFFTKLAYDIVCWVCRM